MFEFRFLDTNHIFEHYIYFPQYSDDQILVIVTNKIKKSLQGYTIYYSQIDLESTNPLIDHIASLCSKLCEAFIFEITGKSKNIDYIFITLTVLWKRIYGDSIYNNFCRLLKSIDLENTNDLFSGLKLPNKAEVRDLIQQILAQHVLDEVKPQSSLNSYNRNQIKSPAFKQQSFNQGKVAFLFPLIL